jgi:hypothetical protein
MIVLDQNIPPNHSPLAIRHSLPFNHSLFATR